MRPAAAAALALPAAACRAYAAEKSGCASGFTVNSGHGAHSGLGQLRHLEELDHAHCQESGSDCMVAEKQVSQQIERHLVGLQQLAVLDLRQAHNSSPGARSV